jgi:hypothetical protein
MNYVKGYLTAENPAGLVRHVAEFPDGRLTMTTYEHPEDSHYFNRPNWRWEAIETMPHGARHIGTYEEEPNMSAPAEFADWLNKIDATIGYETRRKIGTVKAWRAMYEAR